MYDNTVSVLDAEGATMTRETTPIFEAKLSQDSVLLYGMQYLPVFNLIYMCTIRTQISRNGYSHKANTNVNIS